MFSIGVTRIFVAVVAVDELMRRLDDEDFSASGSLK